MNERTRFAVGIVFDRGGVFSGRGCRRHKLVFVELLFGRHAGGDLDGVISQDVEVGLVGIDQDGVAEDGSVGSFETLGKAVFHQGKLAQPCGELIEIGVHH